MVDIIQSRIEHALRIEHISVRDDSHKHAGHAGNPGGAGHYNVTVVSDDFKDKSRIQRHQMIYALFQDMIPARIHALSLKLYTPQEYENR